MSPFPQEGKQYHRGSDPTGQWAREEPHLPFLSPERERLRTEWHREWEARKRKSQNREDDPFYKKRKMKKQKTQQSDKNTYKNVGKNPKQGKNTKAIENDQEALKHTHK